MKYQVVVSDRVKQDLVSHVGFLKTVNKEPAKKLRNRFLAEIRSLETMPHHYPFLNSEYMPAGKYHKLYVENWYLILYQIKDQTVYVDWVVDCRQEYDWLLK